MPGEREGSLIDMSARSGMTALDTRLLEAGLWQHIRSVGGSWTRGAGGAYFSTHDNNAFLEENPAARKLFEVMAIPLDDIFAQNALMYQGEDSEDGRQGSRQDDPKDPGTKFGHAPRGADVVRAVDKSVQHQAFAVAVDLDR